MRRTISRRSRSKRSRSILTRIQEEKKREIKLILYKERQSEARPAGNKAHTAADGGARGRRLGLGAARVEAHGGAWIRIRDGSDRLGSSRSGLARSRRGGAAWLCDKANSMARLQANRTQGQSGSNEAAAVQRVEVWIGLDQTETARIFSRSIKHGSDRGIHRSDLIQTCCGLTSRRSITRCRNINQKIVESLYLAGITVATRKSLFTATVSTRAVADPSTVAPGYVARPVTVAVLLFCKKEESKRRRELDPNK